MTICMGSLQAFATLSNGLPGLSSLSSLSSLTNHLVDPARPVLSVANS